MEGWKFVTRNGGKRRMERGKGKLSKSLYIVGKGVLYRPSTTPPPHTHTHTHTNTSTHTHLHTAILLNDNMDLHLLCFGILEPEGPWCVFYATSCQFYWVLTHDVVFTGTLILLSHTQTHTAHSEATRLTHPYKYIFTRPVMCSQQLS